MQIHIEDLTFNTIIGILDLERTTEQKIIVNLKIDYTFEKRFINYADVSEFVKEHIKTSEFLLLEDLLGSLSKNLKKKFPLINLLYLKVTKPSILPDCRVSLSNTYTF